MKDIKAISKIINEMKTLMKLMNHFFINVYLSSFISKKNSLISFSDINNKFKRALICSDQLFYFLPFQVFFLFHLKIDFKPDKDHDFLNQHELYNSLMKILNLSKNQMSDFSMDKLSNNIKIENDLKRNLIYLTRAKRSINQICLAKFSKKSRNFIFLYFY